MNLLPVATPTAPVNAAGAEDPAATGSGDFTALLAMLVGAASTTLPIDGPWSGSGGSAGADDPTSPFPGSLTTAVAGLPVPEMAAPVVAEPAASMAETAADPAVASLPDVPVAPLTSPLLAGAAPGVSMDGDRRIDGPRRPQPAEHAVPAQPTGPADPAHPAEHAVPAQPTGPADPAHPAEPAVPAQPAVPAVPAAGTSPFQLEEAHRAQPAFTAVPATPAEPAVRAQPAASRPAPGEDRAAAGDPAAQASAIPLHAPDEPERPPEAMTLPEAARFEQPPLGAPASPGHDPGRPEDADRRRDSDRHHDPVQAVTPSDRLPVDVAAADHVEALPQPKGADRSAAPVAPAGAPTPVVPLVAANRSEALAPVEAPAAPTVPATVPEQIVSAVVPLHGRGDGRHEVTLELRPDHLGTIRVEVSVEHQTVNLTLHAAEPATSRLLSAALPELRSALTDAGLTTGQVGVGVDGGGGAGQRRQPADPDRGLLRPNRPGGAPGPAAHESAPVRTVRPAVAGRLDLFL